MRTISDSFKVSNRQGRPARGGSAVCMMLLLTATAVALTGCGRRSIVGTAVNATTSAVSGVANVAGTAVSTTANVAGSAVSTAGSAVSGAGSAASGGAAAGGAGTAAASTSSGVGAGVTGAGLMAGFGVGLHADARGMDAAAMAEGSANCLQAGPNPAASAQLLTSAGWADGGTDNGARLFTKNNVRGRILPDGTCSFQSAFAEFSDSGPFVRQLVEGIYPGNVQTGSPNGGTGQCDGFTVSTPRKAWLRFTAVNGGTCGVNGSTVIVQFL